MFNNKLHHYFGLLMILLYINNGLTVNYNPYESNQHHQLNGDTDIINDATTMNVYHNQQYLNVAQNLQGYANKRQQLYGYYYTPPSLSPAYQQQQPERQQSSYQPTTQLWSGSPIIVEDIANQQSSSSSREVNPATASTTFYKQQETPTYRSNTLLPTRNRNWNTQGTTATLPNYNNNNNIVYHRDFRPQISFIPETEHMQQRDDKITWYNRQQLQRERQLHSQIEEDHRTQQEHQQQQQQFYAANTNLRLNGVSNDLRKDKTADYRELFRRYLENNPLRIKPIY